MLASDLLQNNKYTLLYFYPKDDTPGCTLEAQDFTRLLPDFTELGIQIIGVSKDPETSHEKFCNKYNLGIELIADESGELHEQFGVI
jgi:thioredoxin-dependent peroxiredoxin